MEHENNCKSTLKWENAMEITEDCLNNGDHQGR